MRTVASGQRCIANGQHHDDAESQGFNDCGDDRPDVKIVPLTNQGAREPLRPRCGTALERLDHGDVQRPAEAGNDLPGMARHR